MLISETIEFFVYGILSKHRKIFFLIDENIIKLFRKRLQCYIIIHLESPFVCVRRVYVSQEV